MSTDKPFLLINIFFSRQLYTFNINLVFKKSLWSHINITNIYVKVIYKNRGVYGQDNFTARFEPYKGNVKCERVCVLGTIQYH